MARAAKKGFTRTAMLRRRALRKGVLGGSRPWTYLWAVLFAARLLKRLAALHDRNTGLITKRLHYVSRDFHDVQSYNY